jgi:hypothetical protein
VESACPASDEGSTKEEDSMMRTTLYVRLLLVIAILACLAVALGTEPWGPN